MLPQPLAEERATVRELPSGPLAPQPVARALLRAAFTLV
jgi:hypothetical protein